MLSSVAAHEFLDCARERERFAKGEVLRIFTIMLAMRRAAGSSPSSRKRRVSLLRYNR